jgi:hypothetical protein
MISFAQLYSILSCSLCGDARKQKDGRAADGVPIARSLFVSLLEL